MTEPTLDERIGYAQRRAAELEAELFHYDKAQPFYPLGFKVVHRNPGHWDILARQTPGKASAWKAANPGGTTTERDGLDERAFRIRGEPGRVVVHDERWNPHQPQPRESLQFRSVMAAMLWIAEEMMQEPPPRATTRRI